MSKIYLINDTVREPISGLVSGSVRDALNTDNRIMLTLYGYDATRVNENTVIEYNNNFYDVVDLEKFLHGRTPVAKVNAETVLHRLNGDQYKTGFTVSGTVQECMTRAFKYAAPFTFGLTDINAGTTYLSFDTSIPLKTILREAAKKYKGEIEIAGYTVNLWKHRGSTVPINLFGAAEIESIRSYTNYRENRMSYDIKLYRNTALNVGDEVHIRFDPLEIDTHTRIIAIERNPYNPYEVSIEVGDYQPDIKDIFVSE